MRPLRCRAGWRIIKQIGERASADRGPAVGQLLVAGHGRRRPARGAGEERGV